MQRGERFFALFIGALGLIGIWQSAGLNYLDYYAPGSGFLPIWLCLILVALVAVFLWTGRRAPQVTAPTGNPGRVASIAIGLLVTTALIEPLGFCLPVTLYLLFLLRVVEAIAWRTSVLLSLGTSLAIFCLFRLWLSVPLPRGPWGF